MGPLYYEYNPAEEEYKNMLHLVAYDIRNSKRLRNVAKTCEDFGMRVEYSVFECDLTDKHFQQFWTLLSDIIDEDEDCILAYRICGSCVTRIESMGAVARPGKPLLYILWYYIMDSFLHWKMIFWRGICENPNLYLRMKISRQKTQVINNKSFIRRIRKINLCLSLFLNLINCLTPNTIYILFILRRLKSPLSKTTDKPKGDWD